MRILITGATGFIGRHLVARLAPAHEIIALVRRMPEQPQPGVAYVAQDLTAPLAQARLPAQVDAVIHQAALIDAEQAVDDAAPFLANVVATWRLLCYAAEAGAARFVHASTGGVYGCGPRPFVESDPLHPMDLYSLTKAQAELAVRHAEGDFGRVLLRYFFPYGVGTPNPIPTYVQRALHGDVIRIPHSRTPRLNPLHIADAVEATVRALALEPGAGREVVLNIAGREVTSFAEIAERAAAQVGRTPLFQVVPEAEVIPYYRSDLVASTAQMEQVLGFTPQVGLAEGIRELVDAYR